MPGKSDPAGGGYTGREGRRGIIAFVAVLFVIAVWGETFVSSKILLGHGMAPAEIFFCRFLLAYVCMWALPGRRLFASTPGDELRLAATGLLGGTLYFLSENTALQYSTASNVAILVSSTPLITALLVSVLHREQRLTPLQAGGSALAFAGMVLVVLNGRFILHLSPKGDALALGAALCWSLYSIILQDLGNRYDVRFITRKVFFWGLVPLAPYFLFVHPPSLDGETLRETAVWGNLLYLGLVASMLCFVLWNWSVGVLGTVRTSNMLYTQPFFTMLAAFILLGERITGMAVAGAGLIIVGMVLFERNPRSGSPGKA